ncbi:MAG TPA: HEAT repeat domain-containing protein [Planctomycetota bacterium]|nr:HEAT repeat domain-containing protein [Planctomycetota bacterium]
MRPGTGVQEEAIDVLGGLEVRESMPALAALLQHPEGRVRVKAASWLCHFGSKEGVPVLLKEAQGLIFLNALRRPETWRKLRAGPPVEEVVGTGKDMLDRTARKAGLALEWSPESLGGPRRWIVGSRSPGDPEDRSTMLQVLVNYTHSNYESVLEPDRISVLSSREALAFWTKWWGEGNGK